MNERTSRGVDPGPLADVSVQQAGEKWTVVFVRELRHPPERVWAALTDADQLGEWAPFVADHDLDGPGDVTLTMIDGDTSMALASSVRRAEPPTLLEYLWDTDVLRWELEPTLSGTRLTLSHTLDDKEMGPKVAAGWQLCLVVAERLMDGDPVGVIRGRDAMDHGWERLRDAYAERLGIPVTD